jgi:hypothetical protein
MTWSTRYNRAQIQQSKRTTSQPNRSLSFGSVRSHVCSCGSIVRPRRIPSRRSAFGSLSWCSGSLEWLATTERSSSDASLNDIASYGCIAGSCHEQQAYVQTQPALLGFATSKPPVASQRLLPTRLAVPSSATQTGPVHETLSHGTGMGGPPKPNAKHDVAL